MNDTTPSGSPDVTSPGGASDTTGSGQPTQDEMVPKRSIESIVQKRLKNSSSKIADLERELAQYRGEQTINDDEKTDKSSNPLEAEYKNKLLRKDRENNSLLEKLDKHRQSTLKAQVQSKLIEKDCIDPEVVFTDLKERGLIKLDDDDNVIVTGIYDDLDQLVDDYLSRKDYLRRSKSTGGLGSKPPGINAQNRVDDKQRIVEQVKAARTQGKRLFER